MALCCVSPCAAAPMALHSPPTLRFPASLCLCVYYFNLKVRNSEVAGSRPQASICSSHQGQACSQALGAEPRSPGGGTCEAECGEEGSRVLRPAQPCSRRHLVCGPRRHLVCGPWHHLVCDPRHHGLPDGQGTVLSFPMVGGVRGSLCPASPAGEHRS